jgi:hypothetical protein
MEIKVRNLDPILVKKIDEIAKEQKVSRQVVLRNVIANFAVSEKFKELEGNYLEVIDKLAFIIQDNTKVFNEIKTMMEE